MKSVGFSAKFDEGSLFGDAFDDVDETALVMCDPFGEGLQKLLKIGPGKIREAIVAL